MPFIPHTETDIRQMLEAIGVKSIDELFDEIPADLCIDHLEVPGSESEMSVARIMNECSAMVIRCVLPEAVPISTISRQRFGN
jgi:glycine dehydrogenase subunit 1